MRRRILAALAILLGEPIPHEYTECPNQPEYPNGTWVLPGFTGGGQSEKYDEAARPIYFPNNGTGDPMPNDWETIS